MSAPGDEKDARAEWADLHQHIAMLTHMSAALRATQETPEDFPSAGAAEGRKYGQAEAHATPPGLEALVSHWQRAEKAWLGAQDSDGHAYEPAGWAERAELFDALLAWAPTAPARDSLAELRTCHALIADLNSLVDPEAHPELHARVMATLGPCDEVGTCPAAPVVAETRCKFIDGRCQQCGEPESGMCAGGETDPVVATAQLSVSQGAALAAALDALEVDATDAQRRQAWDTLRDEFYPITAPVAQDDKEYSIQYCPVCDERVLKSRQVAWPKEAP